MSIHVELRNSHRILYILFFTYVKIDFLAKPNPLFFQSAMDFTGLNTNYSQLFIIR
jgi:hypothetical protein